MKHRILILITAATFILGACASANTISPGMAPAPTSVGMEAMPPVSRTIASSSDTGISSAASTNPDRLVTRNADLSIVVRDVPTRMQAIAQLAESMGGFVVSSSTYETTTNNGVTAPQGQIVIRVPASRLQEALTTIKKDTVDVPNESQTGQDVTDQYTDLQSQLKAKEAAAAKLTEIMSAATKTEDVLAVYTQLQQINTEIEVLKGQIKYLDQSVALSAISVNVIAEETVKPLEVGGWKPEGVARDAIQNLIYFWQAFVNALIGFVLLVVPALLTLALPIVLLFLFIRWMVRRRKKASIK